MAKPMIVTLPFVLLLDAWPLHAAGSAESLLARADWRTSAGAASPSADSDFATRPSNTLLARRIIALFRGWRANR